MPNDLRYLVQLKICAFTDMHLETSRMPFSRATSLSTRMTWKGLSWVVEIQGYCQSMHFPTPSSCYQPKRPSIACLRQKVDLPWKLRLGNKDVLVYMPWKQCLTCSAYSVLCGEEAEESFFCHESKWDLTFFLKLVIAKNPSPHFNSKPIWLDEI